MAARKCCAAGPVGPLPSWRTPTVPCGPAGRGVSPPTAGGGWGPWMSASATTGSQLCCRTAPIGSGWERSTVFTKWIEAVWPLVRRCGEEVLSGGEERDLELDRERLVQIGRA